jgi:hypothetical protein
MAQNPLQQFFRQPKIFVGLPSGGIYNKPTTIQGETDRIPVFGMTGMDEIVMKTPDALLSGDSTVKVIQSCCPTIHDAWDLCSLDINLILTAIRIATFGGELAVTNACSECQTVNSYDINLNAIVDHYSKCKYDNRLVLDELTIVTRPLTYKQSSSFALKNFEMQQKLKQLASIEEETQRKELMDSILQDLGNLRNEIFAAGIESIDTGSTIVTEREFIREWLENVDRSAMESVVNHIEYNRDAWDTPKHHVKCDNCGHEDDLTFDLDQTNFFVNA